jgi:L-iditol 2-dehydrogenase
LLAYTYGSKGQLTLLDRPIPVVKADSVIVKVLACSVCGTDLRTYLHGSAKITPGRIIGHEFCGEIIEVGGEVDGFTVGDRVTAAPAIGCGKCRLCKNGATNMCDNLQTIGFQYDGAFAEFMAIPAQALNMGNVYKVPDNISAKEATLAEPVACCLNAQEFLNIAHGDFVVIFGAGFIGCMHAEIAYLKGAAKVVMVELADNRINAAKKMLPGLDIIDPKSADVLEVVTELTDGRGADVIITACSSGKAHAQALDIAAKRARVSLFGGIAGDAIGFVDSNAIHYKELSVFGAHASTPAQNKEAMGLIASGKLDVKKYIANVCPLKEVVAILETIKNENITKAIVEP